ncbi:MAG: PilT/PilU family type 4a pilus ATPase [Phycisphaerales bacterium]|nr:PilT/PilU family type 4a pilus ATPase [Phycisphaerales bacterium]NNM27341.1 PilT/PilU family type 4a pilus ATPase [Phycisphaerales bacterium]
MLGALTIQRLLMKMSEVEASDLHIKAGSPPVLRIASVLHKIDSPALNADDTRQLLAPLIPDHLRSMLEQRGGIDFSHHEGEDHRFRCSVFHAGHGLHAAIRRVNPKVPDFDDLNLPPIYETMTSETHEGLVIVCGVTGSGKSSTLAAMIDHINHRRGVNILTVEDPIEYLFRPDHGFVSQREIGIDVPDFPTALRSAVRQDPDVLMIGEMRDRETMLAGIQAAETGHLVFATLHTADTMQAFARVLEFFDTRDHAFIRSGLSAGLRAVMAQRLIPCVKEGVQRVPATEVLLNNSTVSDKIREGEDEDLPAVINASEGEGMHDFTSSIAQLVKRDMVALKTAEKYAPNAEALRSRVRGIQVKADTLVQRVKK